MPAGFPWPALGGGRAERLPGVFSLGHSAWSEAMGCADEICVSECLRPGPVGEESACIRLDNHYGKEVGGQLATPGRFIAGEAAGSGCTSR
jgi:hypothetical protein